MRIAVRPTVTLAALAPAAIAVAAAVASVAPAFAWEAPRTFQASEILKPAQVKGPHFTVTPTVKTEGYFYLFDIKTDYGPLEAEGRDMLLLRLNEVGALAQLDEVSKSSVFLAAAGNSVLNVGKGVAAAVKDPGATAKGIGGGVKRFGTNLGRKAKRTGDEAVEAVSSDDDKKAEGQEKSKAAAAGTGMAYSVLGVNKSARKWAQKVGADPYTTNPILKKALTDIGQIDAAGGIAAKVVVPIPMVVSGTASVGNLVWSKDPEELLKINEAKLKEMGVGADTIKRLYVSKGFSLSLYTRLVASLSAVNVPGCGDYVATAAEAQTEREADFFVESAGMLERFHKTTPVAALLPDSRALVAKTKDGRAVALLPVDWVSWTEAYEKALTEVGKRAKAELGARTLEMQLTGSLSAEAKKETAARGWTALEKVPSTIEVLLANAAKAAPKK